jgi:hypothetical protein
MSDDRRPDLNAMRTLTGWHGVLLLVRFMSELALLAVLAVVGALAADTTPARVALAVLLPLVAAAVWGLLIAPRAVRRLPDPGRLVLELVLFGGAAAGLAATGHPEAALTFAAVAVSAAVLVRLFSPGS